MNRSSRGLGSIAWQHWLLVYHSRLLAIHLGRDACITLVRESPFFALSGQQFDNAACARFAWLMTMPNFLVIGAVKAGTTALFYQLMEHPQIFMCPLKEPRFFAYDGQEPDHQGPYGEWRHPASYDMAAYRLLFKEAGDEPAVGEVSPHYLYMPRAPERIRHHVPDAKLIAILRQPADRAFSAFCHTLRDGYEITTDFSQGLLLEDQRVADNWAPIWHYRRVGYYSEQLNRYFRLFDREQIRIYRYENYRAEPLSVLKDIFQFLEVDKQFSPDLSLKVNVTGIPRSVFLQRVHRFLTRPHPIKEAFKPLFPPRLRKSVIRRAWSLVERINLIKPEFPAELRRQLTESYRQDILKLQDLIQQDLSDWLA